ncbi:alpha/beta hydrolase [Conyzicola sp.]|uniref:alpha/beta hydrolase n=1 Tax=Conyzicola sp. TaxID=1969404 RepID=UPI003988EDD6
MYDLTIRDVDRSGDQPIVVLDRNSQTATRGDYCLLLESGDLVRLSSNVEDRGPALVGREALLDPCQTLEAGMRASWSGINFLNPQDAGLEATEVDVPTVVGPAPAWLVPSQGSPSNTWAIHIHGLGSPRAGTLRGVQVAVAAELTSLVVSYRNDGDGPTVGTGRSELGSTELQDVRAAVCFARDNGAHQVIVFGWSMGGAIALQLADDPALRGVIAGLVLESPILDWVSTIKANCVRAGLPAWVGPLALPWLSSRLLSRVTGLRNSVDLHRFDWIARADELTVPTLILHGRGDTSSPFELSTRLWSLSPDVVDLEAFEADHTMTWNSDRERWPTVVTAWLGKRK